MTQEVATLSYNQVTTTTAAINRQVEYLIKPDNTNQNRIIVEASMDLSLSTSMAQVSSITVSTGNIGEEYAVSVQVTGQPTLTYRHKQVAGDTATSIAGFLAILINTNNNVIATASGGVITVKSAKAGDTFTLDNSQSTVPSKVVTATVTAATGTPKHRKLLEASLIFSINTSGFLILESDGNFFDGAAVPVVLQKFGKISVASAPRALATIISDQA